MRSLRLIPLNVALLVFVVLLIWGQSVARLSKLVVAGFRTRFILQLSFSSQIGQSAGATFNDHGEKSRERKPV